MKSRLGGGLFLLLCAFYGWQTGYIAELPVDATEAMNARSLPYGLALIGGLLSLWLLFRGDVHVPQPDEQGVTEEGQTPPMHWGNLGVTLALLLWTSVFGLALSRIGFWLAICMFLWGGFVLLGERRGLFGFGLAAFCASLFYALLRFGLGLYLAPGSFWVALGWISA
jgi:putative tricarboxylic transport membrane protein